MAYRNQYLKYGCPICGFQSKHEEEVAEHMIDTADNIDHQEMTDMELLDTEGLYDEKMNWNQL